VALERLVFVFFLGLSPEALRLRLRPGDDRRPNMRLEREMDVHHA
jgi:hypothetical protein